ncbi:MAG: glycosyltransferase [Halothece sp. Uz-M2-17]|nr:glycosyltransferase [Halothece sp. Uz-M2-17]
MPKVSIIIATYNYGRYLSQAIESVFKQTYPEWELIVVDDGSTDDTAQIIEPYLHQLRYEQQSNQGVAATRNHGLKLANGELIAFLDADDFYLPQKLETQVNFLNSNPSLGLAHSGWLLVNEQGKQITTVEPWLNAPQLDLETWLKWKPVLPGPMLFRREWLEKVGGFDTSLRYAEDKDLVFRLAVAGCQAGWVYQPTLCYRQHKSSKKISKRPQVLAVQKQVLEKFFQRSDLPDEICRCKDDILFYSLVWMAGSLYDNGHPQEMAKYLEVSLQYTADTPTEIILHWIESFATEKHQYSEQLDTKTLVNQLQWQQAVFRALTQTF